MSTLNDRIRGCIVGGALGDAIGLFTEFFDRTQCQAQYGYNPRFKLQPPAPPGFQEMLMDHHRSLFEEASWTDDTDQSLLILMSFLRGGGNPNGIDPLDFAARLRHWVDFGFRPMGTLAADVGHTVGSAVKDPDFLSNPLGVSTSVWEKGGRHMAANGAVMRTSVVGALFYKHMEKVHSTAMNLAGVTHADPRCLVSCTIASAMVAAIIRGEVHSDEDIRKVIEAAIIPVTTRHPSLKASYVDELRTILWKNSLEELKLDESRAIGYTYKCIASGIWALRQGLMVLKAQSVEQPASLAAAFERIITQLAMAGGDADTNGAVAGSLVGVLFGYSNLPNEWVQDLKHRDWILSKADAATYLIANEGSPYHPESDPDNLIDGGKGEMSKDELRSRWTLLNQESDRRIGEYWLKVDALPKYA